MKITITVKELMDKGIWEDVRELLGIDYYAGHEGLLNIDDEITLSDE